MRDKDELAIVVRYGHSESCEVSKRKAELGSMGRSSLPQEGLLSHRLPGDLIVKSVCKGIKEGGRLLAVG